MKKLICLAVLAVSACTTKPLGTSVPTQAGHNLNSARVAVQSCATEAGIGGDSAVIGGYATSILLLGPVFGSLVTVPMQDNLRAQGEFDQVDRCMTERGFDRRYLSDGEMFWLNDAHGEERVRRLDHLVNGGTIDTYGTPRA